MSHSSRFFVQLFGFVALLLLQVSWVGASDTHDSKTISIALPPLPNYSVERTETPPATVDETPAAHSESVQAVAPIPTKKANQGLDIILVMDSSGSMKKNDPNDLRKPAAKLLLSLLGEGDRASVVSFSDQGYPVAYLTQTQSREDQEALFSAIGKISNKGGYTNITGGLQAAKRVFDQAWDDQRKHVVVLMSDGKMDLASAAKDKQATAELITELLPEMKKMGVAVHTIAFTESSDMRLLQSIAGQTDGHFNIARSDRDLHTVFASIFEQSKEPDILPMYGERFLVDSNVREITIVANKEALDTKISFTAPDGREITEANRPNNIRWLLSDQFDLITIQNPQSGEWQIFPPGDKNRAYIITDLEMQLLVSPAQPQPGDLLELDVWLEEDGERLSKQEVLGALRVNLVEEMPDGRVERLALMSERTADNYLSGFYSAKLRLHEYGRYRIEVSASTGTFDRVKSKVIDLQPAMAPHQVLSALQDPHSNAIQPLAGVERPHTAPLTHRPEPVAAKVEPVAATPPAHHAPAAEPSNAEKPVEHPAEEEGGVLIGLLIFFLFNLILVGGAAAVWWLKRRAEKGGKS